MFGVYMGGDMGEEVILSLFAGIKLLVLAFIGTWYSICGRGVIQGFWGRRRVVLPLILCITWTGFAIPKFSWGLMGVIWGSWIVYYISLSVGYGGNTFIQKLFRRGVYGLALGIAPIMVAWYFGLWNMLIVNVILNLVCSVWLGIRSGITAAYEEGLLGTVQFLIPIFMI